MFGLDNKSGINVMPPIAPADSQTPLWFTEGGAGLSATYPGQDWFNQIQAELLNVLKAADISPQKGNLSQLSSAISKLASAYALSVVQTTGPSLTSVMSQKAVTDYLGTKASSSHFMVTEQESRMLSPNKEILVLANDNKTSGVWDDKLQRILWAFDGTGTLTNGTVPVSLVSGAGTAATRNVGVGDGQVPDMSHFPISGKGSDSVVTSLPNGLILQCFSRLVNNSQSIGSSTDNDITFPAAFPTRVLGVFVSKASYPQIAVSAESQSLTGFNAKTTPLIGVGTQASVINIHVLGY